VRACAVRTILNITNRQKDHVQIQAITTLLRLNIKVAYLDGRGGDGVDFVNFFNGVGKDESGIRELVLLYRCAPFQSCLPLVTDGPSLT